MPIMATTPVMAESRVGPLIKPERRPWRFALVLHITIITCLTRSRPSGLSPIVT
jgi:hypothetical protein